MKLRVMKIGLCIDYHKVNVVHKKTKLKSKQPTTVFSEIVMAEAQGRKELSSAPYI
jgi:hypothetical protein